MVGPAGVVRKSSETRLEFEGADNKSEGDDKANDQGESTGEDTANES